MSLRIAPRPSCGRGRTLRPARSRAGGWGGVHGWLPRLALLVLLQVVLGIGTLVMVVPLSLALGHQALAFMLAGAVTAYLADMTPRRI